MRDGVDYQNRYRPFKLAWSSPVVRQTDRYPQRGSIAADALTKKAPCSMEQSEVIKI